MTTHIIHGDDVYEIVLNENDFTIVDILFYPRMRDVRGESMDIHDLPISVYRKIRDQISKEKKDHETGS